MKTFPKYSQLFAGHFSKPIALNAPQISLSTNCQAFLDFFLDALA